MNSANKDENKDNFLVKAKNKAVKIMDQNDDGKFDFKDVSEVAGNVGSAVKKKAESVKKSADIRSRKKEEKTLQPFFEEDIDGASFSLSKLIRVCEIDKKRLESEVCKGSIGHYSNQNDLTYVNIYHNNIDKFGISLFPDATYEFYYVDPTDRDRYIALEEYFSFLKVARINELQKIAQDLGAKHFRVTYKEQNVSLVNKKIKENMKVGAANKAKASTDLSRSFSSNDFSTVEIAAEMECDGHEPIEPRLKYLQKDSSIQNLISMRMQDSLKHHKFMINMSNSSGIKESDAVKIDAVLKKIKVNESISITNEVKKESRRFLEYEIDF